MRPEVYNEISNFYTATVYQKGAEVIRMLKRLIGADAFRAGMDMYFHRYDGQAATVEDFIGCFADVSGRDFSRFMRWYSQAGTPKVTVRTSYDPTRGHLSRRHRSDARADARPGDETSDDDAARARPRRPAGRRLSLCLLRRHAARSSPRGSSN